MLDKSAAGKKALIGRHGGGQVVSVLAFYFDDPTSNPADVYLQFFCEIVVEKDQKINKYWPGLTNLKKALPTYLLCV